MTPLENLTAQLSATFAMWYLGQECFWKAMFTILQKYLHASNIVAFFIYASMATMATIVLAIVGNDARPKNLPARGPICERAAAALALWSEPKLWLIAGSNITFGFSAAYLNGFINAKWLHEALSKDFIGFLGAVICLIATLSSKVFGLVAEKSGKLPIIALGSLCFLGIALLSFVKAPEGKGPGSWGWGIIVFYVLQGMGRGVYESTNKGVFGDFFPGALGVGAFANCMMQNTFSGTIGFIMGSMNVDSHEVWILLAGSILTVPCLQLALSMKTRFADVKA